MRPRPCESLRGLCNDDRYPGSLPLTCIYKGQRPLGPSAMPLPHHPARPPPGWAPPFAGAAPPVPPGVNPNLWGAGAWQFNPAYLYSQAGQPPPQNNAGWAAGYGWNGPVPGQHHHHQQPTFNPYKRVPRPPSAEYMANSLVQNPLGLSNMIPR